MKKYKKEIATENEVIDRAISILKEEKDIYLTKEELREVYDITVKYFRDTLRNGEWATVLLPNLGRAYYRQKSINERIYRNRGNFLATGNEIYKTRQDNFRDLYNKIEQHYQDYQPKKNVKKSHRWYHVIVPFKSSASIRGFQMEDIEEIQNKIQ